MMTIEIIKKHIPALVATTNVSDFQIVNAIKKYETRNKVLHQREDCKLKPHNLFDWILLAEVGNAKADTFLLFLNNLIKELIAKIDKKLLPKVNSTLKELAFAVESDINQLHNPVHMNFIGELAGLNHILTLSERRFCLKFIEEDLSNGKTADYVFHDTFNNQLLYIDVVSIHNINIGKLSTNQDLVDFLVRRLRQKWENKTKNLTIASNKLKVGDKDIHFKILPILWTEINELINFKEAFNVMEKTFSEEDFRFLPFCSLLPLQSMDGSIDYEFCKVSDIIERWNKNN